MKLLTMIFGIAIVVLVKVAWSDAQQSGSSDTATAGIARLDERVSLLEKRVGELERASAPRQTVAPDKAAWRKLQVGMTENDVRALLGEPKAVDVNGSYINWQYGEVIGYVRFTPDKRRVNGWREP